MSNDIDKRLTQLAVAAQQHLPGTLERRQAIARLLSAIQKSGQLGHPYSGQFQGLYEEIYAVAKQMLFRHIYEKIDEYDVQRGEFLQWANFLFSRRFFPEAIREITQVCRGVDPKQVKRFTLDDLEISHSDKITSQTSSDAQELMEYIKEDPEGIFENEHTCNNPAANFQFLAIQVTSGYSWKEISAELGIKVPTLSTFYQRCLTKFKPKLKDYLLK